jgi:hypothetical protein
MTGPLDENVRSYVYAWAILFKISTKMNPLHNIGRNVSKNANASQENKNVNERVNISISKRAYDALVRHAKQITDDNPDTQKPFTIEEILDEEILLLFNDDWKET